MSWLVLIIRLRGAAPRYRRRVHAALADGGGVPVSEGVWAIPETGMHRAAVDAATRHAAAAGGDIVIMATTPENSPSHAVFESKLAERLTIEAESVIRRCGELAATAGPCVSGETLQDGQIEDLWILERDAQRLSRLDVVGLEVVAAAAVCVARTGKLRGSAAAA